MRKLAVSIVVLILLLAGAGSASAQQTSSLGPVARTLARYLPVRADLAAGQRILGPIEVPNEDAVASDPDVAALIYRYQRFTEVAEAISRVQGPGNLVASVALFADAEGAWGDVQASAFGDFTEVEQQDLGGIGERGILFHIIQGIAPNQRELYYAVFQRDRIEVAVAVAGPVGRVAADEVLPLATVIDGRIQAMPPGAVTAAERSLLEDPTPTVLVRGAVRLLLAEFYQPVEVNVLLAEAWEGASRALRRAGVAEVPPPPAYPADEDEAIALHVRSFPALEQLAEGHISQSDLAFAALSELADRRDDCHTSYLTRQRFQSARARDRGEEAVLIGVSFSSDRPLRIVGTSPNSPAERAGLRAGQEVLAINGQRLEEYSLTEARALIDPRAGVPTTFTVRNPSGRVQDITVAPAVFSIPSLESRILPDNIGYMTFYGFNSDTEQLDQMRAVLEDWESKGVVGWIIDLRRNSGGNSGLMNAMMSLFVSGGRLYGIEQRDELPEFVTATSGLTLPFQRPLVFLVGPASASAGEIMPGSLRARGRAVLVGDTTMGCIGGFSYRGLLDGSAFNPTSIEILIGPDGERLHRIGVTPDVYAPITDEDLEAGRDPGLPAAVEVIRQITSGQVPAAAQPPRVPQRPRALLIEY